MKLSIKVGIIGDHEERLSQTKTDEALKHTASFLKINLHTEWLHTSVLPDHSPDEIIPHFQGIMSGPGNYSHPQSALNGIQYCRINKIPFLGT